VLCLLVHDEQLEKNTYMWRTNSKHIQKVTNNCDIQVAINVDSKCV
jgi:hypothetical protein